MPQLGDDGDLLSTLPFNATPHVLGQDPPQVKNTKTPCLISFDIFCPSFGDVLIHERLSVGLIFYMKDMQKICSNMCFMLKTDRVLPSKGPPSASPPQTTARLPPTNLKNPIHVFFLRDDIMCKRKKFPFVLEVYKLVDSDNEKVRAQCEECPNDGLKSNNNENVRVQKGYQKLRHLVIVGAAH